MTSWDSGPYIEGHLMERTSTGDKFVMNYRLLMPNGYSSTYNPGYPMIVHLHGAVERANCYYQNCYHATPAYNVQANTPPAPKTSTHKLLNNDHSLNVGGQQYLNARNLAGTRKPNDPSMPSRAFPGFVLVAQMFNIWDSLQVQDVIRIVRLVAEKYKVDQDRIYVQGLSIGGYGVYECMKRASWLFAAALPMSAVWDANIFKQNQQGRVAHIPVWVFQGGKDTRPSTTFTNNIVNKLRNAGANVRYTVYNDLSHVVWGRAYGTSDYFTWMLKQTKANPTLYKGITVIDKAKNQYPKLMLAEGFLAYQWQKNGVTISTAKSNTLTVTTPGTYRVRFSRKSATPTTASQWNRWSDPVNITQAGTTVAVANARMVEEAAVDEAISEQSGEEIFEFDVYPNPATKGDINLDLRGAQDGPLQVRIIDQLGRELYNNTFESPASVAAQQLTLPGDTRGGVYVLLVNQGNRQLRRRVMVKD